MFELFFEIGYALTELFKLKYELKEEYFYELTEEQYEQLKFEGQDITQTWYMILPKNYKYQTIETLIVTESEADNFLNSNP